MEERNVALPNLSTVSRSSWSAIFSGTVVSLVVRITLAMLGAAIGLATINPATETNPVGSGLGIGAIIWWIICGIIALYIGGWVAGRFAGLQRVFDGALHGLVTWGLSTLLMLFFLTTTIGAVIGGGVSLLKGAAGATGQIAQNLPPGVKQQVTQQVQTGVQQGQQQAQQMSPEEKQRLQQQAEQKAREAGQKAAHISSGIAWGLFIMFVLEGLAAALGGAAGRVKGPVKV